MWSELRVNAQKILNKNVNIEDVAEIYGWNFQGAIQSNVCVVLCLFSSRIPCDIAQENKTVQSISSDDDANYSENEKKTNINSKSDLFRANSFDSLSRFLGI